MAPATVEPLMDEREFLDALEHFDPRAAGRAAEPAPEGEDWLDHVEDALPVANYLPVPVWAFDTANDEPDCAPARGQNVWLVSGFLVGAAAAVLLFRDSVANILTLLR